MVSARLSTFAVVMVAAPVVFVTVACGGGGSEKLVDTGQADTLAHQALLAESDLPGTGWTVSKTDQFDDSGPDGTTAACKDIATRRATALATEVPSRASRAERELQHDTGGAIPASVESEVDVFKDTSTPANSLSAYQDALKTGNFETCLRDSLTAAVGDPNTKIDTKSVAAFSSPPSGGSVSAFEFTFTTQGQTFVLHFETYLWRYANLGITLSVNGTKDDITADLVKAAMTKLQAHLDALPKK